MRLRIKHDPTDDHWGSVQAVDLETGKQVWQYETHLPWSGATLATAGGVMFSGSTDGHFMAFDAKTGKVLWTSPQLSSGIIGVPTTYMVDGKDKNPGPPPALYTKEQAKRGSLATSKTARRVMVRRSTGSPAAIPGRR